MAGYRTQSGGGAMPWLYGAGMGLDLIGGLIGGQGQHGIERREKRNLDQQYKMGEMNMGQESELWNILRRIQANPMQDVNQVNSAIAPLLNNFSGQMGNQVGTDSGAFKGAMQNKQYSILMDHFMRNKQNNTQNMLRLV